MACRYGFLRTVTVSSNTTLSPAAKLAQTEAVTFWGIFWVGNRKCSGSNHQIANPRLPARVKVSSFDMVATLDPRKSIGTRLNSIKVGLDDSKFKFFFDFRKSRV